MALTVYHYPKCSTCRKALQWLTARGVAFTPVDLVATPPSRDTLARLLATSGLPVARLFNTSGQSYRDGGFSARLPSLTTDEVLAALAADGKLIKRPLVDGDGFVLVGFQPEAWEARFPARS